MDGVRSVEENQAAGGESSGMKKPIIDTAAPFHSIQEAGSRFGGTVNWKANRVRSMEKVNIPEAKPENSENQKEDVEYPEKLIDEMKLSLEKSQKQEQEAKKDSEVMWLKVQEMEQMIENEASNAAKAMHAAAVSALKALEEELESLLNDHASKELVRERTRAASDLKSKLDESSSLLHDLKAKLEETKLKQQSDEEQRKELEEVKCKLAKATAEVNYLRVTSLSLTSELEEEKSVNDMIRQREEMASDAAASHKDELERTRSQVALIQKEEEEARENMIGLPKLEEAAQEADQAKMLAQEAHLRLNQAKEEAEQAKAKSNEMESTVLEAQKELEAVKDSEKSAMEAAKAFQVSESAKSKSNAESSSEVTLTVEQYNQLCKLADEANEQANLRILAVNSQLEMAKEFELRSLMELEELDRELAERKELLKEAVEKAEKANEQKLGVEQELRSWRADQEQRRNACEETQGTVIQNKNSNSGSEKKKELKKLDSTKKSTESATETNIKKKKSLSSKISMIFSKRKTHPTK